MKIVDVPFHYEALVRHKRKRNFNRCIYRASAPVEISELTNEDAPIALRFKERNEETATELRWYDGQLWAQKLADEQPVGIDWLIELNEEPHEYGNPLFAGEKGYDRAGPIEDDIEIQEVQVSGRESVESEIRANASQVLLIEGSIWEKTHEPYLHLTTSQQYAWVSIAKSWQQHAARLSFRMDQQDIIREACADELVGNKHFETADVEVLVPEALKRPADERALTDAARSLLDSMKTEIANQDVDYFIAFRELREAVKIAESALEAGTALDMDALSLVLRSAAQANMVDGEEAKCSKWLVENALAAIRRVELSQADKSLSDVPGL